MSSRDSLLSDFCCVVPLGPSHLTKIHRKIFHNCVFAKLQDENIPTQFFQASPLLGFTVCFDFPAVYIRRK